MSEMEQNEFNELLDQLKISIECGDVLSMRQLGDLYYQGVSGKDENICAALPYWKMAADHGDDEIAFKVGICLFYGNGCEENLEQGFAYLLKSAKSENTDAQYFVGLCYVNGEGTHKDFRNGEYYLRRAALKNHSRAQMNLARAILQEDNSRAEEAIHWVCCAHLNGLEEATNSLREFMTVSEIAAFVNSRLEYIKKYGVEPPQNTQSVQNTNKEGCYIATAVYGSYDAKEVMVLRDFRDCVLQKHCIGRLFIRIYYYFSPAIAKRLKRTSIINLIVKWVLDLFVDLLQ